MLSLEEAIKHCGEVAERLENSCKRDWMSEDDERCASEHRQLAEWLVELKAWRRLGELLNEVLTEEQIKKLKEKRRNDT